MDLPVVMSLVLLATLTPMTLASIVALSESDRDYILEKHNTYRAGEPAVTMPDLVWSSSLEAEAQSWADTCNYGHQTGQDW
ncbi:venom allergen 5, partial [Elysia marginata]